MKVKTVFKGVCGIMLALAFTACSETSIEGSWVEPVPGMEQMMQGFTLEKNGKASSINMATLQYETWERSKNLLILTGKSIGNSQIITFSDTLTIEELTTEKLVLKKGNATFYYQKTVDVKQENEIPVDMHTAEISLDYYGTYKGTLPAADCPGINVTLTLNKNKTFSKTEEYIDRDTFNSAGTYSINGNYLYTIDERQDTVFYKVEENRLRMLDRNKEVITGNLEEHYILKK